VAPREGREVETGELGRAALIAGTSKGIGGTTASRLAAEVAASILFLASDDTSHDTGACNGVNDGSFMLEPQRART
jgi:NAD(P)-dependent dehydrogenase (short-subunit alcohol dehydrogenase family)